MDNELSAEGSRSDAIKQPKAPSAQQLDHQTRIKRVPQFYQTFYPGSTSNSYDCGPFGGCVIPPSQQYFGGYNVNYGLGYNQGYYGGANAFNYGGFGFGKRRRRSVTGDVAFRGTQPKNSTPDNQKVDEVKTKEVETIKDTQTMAIG